MANQMKELDDVQWPYPWNTVAVGGNFRLALACEKWRAKQMAKRHSKGGKKFVIYYGNHPVRHMRVMRVA